MNHPSILDLIERHYQQIDLFYYQNRRDLPRPKTNILDVLLWSLGYLIIIAFCVALNIMINQPIFFEIPVSVAVYFLVSEFSLKKIGVKVVECYQHYAKESTRRKCLCVPSCSEYTCEAVQKFGIFKGLVLGFFRILKCTPFSKKSGYDPVPNEFKLKNFIKIGK